MSRRSGRHPATLVALLAIWAGLAFAGGTAIAHLNHIEGNDNDNTLSGTGDSDHIRGYGGADDIYAKAGQDVVEAGQGFDDAEGGEQGDEMNGGDGRDKLKGKAGQDEIQGGDGADLLLRGGEDFDIHHGYGGDDYIDAYDNGPDQAYGDDGANDTCDVDGKNGPPTDLVHSCYAIYH